MKLKELQVELDMIEQSGLADVYDVKMEDTGQSLFIALENSTEKVIGWCNARVSLDDKPVRTPIYLLNGKPYPHLMADGDYVK